MKIGIHKYCRDLPVIELDTGGTEGDIFRIGIPYIRVFHYFDPELGYAGGFDVIDQHPNDGKMETSHGFICEKELEEIFQKIEDSGFWEMSDVLGNKYICDAGVHTIFINLPERSKKVICNPPKDSNDTMAIKFDELYKWIGDFLRGKSISKTFFVETETKYKSELKK